MKITAVVEQQGGWFVWSISDTNGQVSSGEAATMSEAWRQLISDLNGLGYIK